MGVTGLSLYVYPPAMTPVTARSVLPQAGVPLKVPEVTRYSDRLKCLSCLLPTVRDITTMHSLIRCSAPATQRVKKIRARGILAAPLCARTLRVTGHCTG